ncbi:MAG: hypothetical protein OXO50_07535 [Caldilineaceae bacterium]|nr:hypothetical protein [Caldilineaceae bacterium]
MNFRRHKNRYRVNRQDRANLFSGVKRSLTRGQVRQVRGLHAAQGGKTEALYRQALVAAKPVYTLPSLHNAHLITLGAQPIPPDDPSALLST